MASVLIDIRKLEKRYILGGGMLKGRPRIIRAVDGIDLQIIEGETLGLVGESGCGKSTLARLLMRLEKPDGGEIVFRGQNIFSLSPEEMKTYRRRVQMIFQDPYSSLNPRKTALGIIQEPLDIHRVALRKENRETAKQLMARVGLSREQAGRYPHEFSGGQRQRIGIARALALAPALLVADEPVSALDVSVQAQIMNLLRELRARMGLALLFIAHDLAVVRYLCSRVAVMFRGRVVESGPADAIFGAPAHPYTRSLLDSVPDVDRAPAKSAPGAAESPFDAPAEAADWTGCAFHPRCPLARPECLARPPRLAGIGQGRECACRAV